MDLKEKIKSISKEIHPKLIEIRRHIHANPELSFEEYETAKFVSETLKSFGLNPTDGVAGTGVTLIIEGNNPQQKVIALRADMDALPIEEANDVPYKSNNKGIMHACGHDVHTASLLGTAYILNQLKSTFSGTVKFIFQPGEEKAPGGASLMIKDGVLENPHPTQIIGQHVMPLIDVGKVGFREGMYMASTDELYVKVIGKGGHGATPELTVDPVLIAAHIVVGLQQIISRNVSPKMPSVLSFGKVVANGATNIIPNEVNLEGTFRAMDETWRSLAHQKMKHMAEHIAEAMGGKCEFRIEEGYPYLENNPALTRKAKAAAIEYLGTENVVDLDIWMGGEDFAFYSQQIEATFYRIGVRNEEKGINSLVHTPTFDIDESALETGCGLMSWIAIKTLTE